jgi:hypothetical protein
VVIAGSVPHLLKMAFRAGLFYRTGPDSAMAVRALIVGCIWLGRHFGIFNFIFPMAVQATLGRRGVFFRILEMTFTAGNERGIIIAGVMMAIIAGDVIVGSMLGMLEENAAGSTAVLDADGLIRGFGGKSGVTEKTYNKENDSHAVDQLQISL